MKLLLSTLGLCDLGYIVSLRLVSIYFVKLGFVNQYLIYKLLFFTFKDHLFQAPINIFVKSQLENIPCFVASLCCNYSSHRSVQKQPDNTSEWCGCVPK